MLSIKVIKEECLTLNIKKGKFINWFIGPWLISQVRIFDCVQIHELHLLWAQQQASEVCNITLIKTGKLQIILTFMGVDYILRTWPQNLIELTTTQQKITPS